MSTDPDPGFKDFVPPEPKAAVNAWDVLQEERASPPTYYDPEDKFFHHFALAQGSFDPIYRSRTVQVAMKSGGSYTFSYAPLETILAATVPHLTRNGISLTQSIKIVRGLVDPERGEMDEPIHYLTTTLRGHGHKEHNEVMIFKSEATAQAYGSAVTYARRMSVTLLLCVAADDDNDGSDTQMKGPPVQKQARGLVTKPVTHSPPLRGDNDAPIERPGELGRERDYSPKELAEMEGNITDARDELLMAAAEGRRIGIEQIWDEIKANEYVATRVWRDLQRHPDHFKTIKDTLKAKEVKAARGPKPNPDSGESK